MDGEKTGKGGDGAAPSDERPSGPADAASGRRSEEGQEEEGAKEESTDSSEYSTDSDACSGEEADEVAAELGGAGEMADGTKQILRKLQSASAAVNMNTGGAQGADKRYSFLDT